MNLKYQLKMLVQNMTQVKPRSPAVSQRLLEHDLTRLNGLTIPLCTQAQLRGVIRDGVLPLDHHGWLLFETRPRLLSSLAQLLQGPPNVQHQGWKVGSRLMELFMLKCMFNRTGSRLRVLIILRLHPTRKVIETPRMVTTPKAGLSVPSRYLGKLSKYPPTKFFTKIQKFKGCTNSCSHV